MNPMQQGAFGKRPVKKGFSSSSLRRSTSFFTPHLARQPLEQETILVSMVSAALVARAGGGHRQRCKFWRSGDEWKGVWKGRLGNKSPRPQAPDSPDSSRWPRLSTTGNHNWVLAWEPKITKRSGRCSQDSRVESSLLGNS